MCCVGVDLAYYATRNTPKVTCPEKVGFAVKILIFVWWLADAFLSVAVR